MSPIVLYKQINPSIYTEWAFRISVTVSFLCGICFEHTDYYPDSANILSLITLWLYFLDLKIIAVIVLITYLMPIHYFHFTV